MSACCGCSAAMDTPVSTCVCRVSKDRQPDLDDCHLSVDLHPQLDVPLQPRLGVGDVTCRDRDRHTGSRGIVPRISAGEMRA